MEFDIASEDIHMAIESELTSRIGDAGKRLHTARSRNDQVATDFRLYCRQEAEFLALLVTKLRAAITVKARQNLDVILPGYTHLQRAQPVLLAQHLLAWQAMFERDARRLYAALHAANASPLGAAALAGTAYPIDREQTADDLGFADVIANSMDAVSDRDFACDLVYACSMCMMHLSRVCEELILWSSTEFAFITLADAYSTGSSIMPQKKNPDFAELTRGKTGRVYGSLIGLLTMLKGLPLAYNKDLQEDKEGTFDAADTLTACLEAVRGMIATMTVNSEAMRAAAAAGFMSATDLADYLVGKGLAFRDAHAVVGHLVLFADKTGRGLEQLTLDELCEFSAAFDADALELLKVENVVAAKTSYGGTSPQSVLEQLELVEEELGLTDNERKHG
jgi:argininosuccinate lyase